MSAVNINPIRDTQAPVNPPRDLDQEFNNFLHQLHQLPAEKRMDKDSFISAIQTHNLDPRDYPSIGPKLWHYAIIENWPMAFMQWLIQNGIDVNTPLAMGWTALQVAVTRLNKNLVQFLLDNQANVRAQNKNGDTALHFAASLCQIPDREIYRTIIQLLLQHGAKLQAYNKQNMTMWDIAEYCDNQTILSMYPDSRKSGCHIL